jgi:hypothetical protein
VHTTYDGFSALSGITHFVEQVNDPTVANVEHAARDSVWNQSLRNAGWEYASSAHVLLSEDFDALFHPIPHQRLEFLALSLAEWNADQWRVVLGTPLYVALAT